MEEVDSNLLAKFQDLDAIWNLSQVSVSETAFRDLLPAAEKLAEKDRSFLIEVLSLLARAESVQGRYPVAQSHLKKAEELLNEDGASYRVSAKIRWLLEKGRVHILEKTPSQARMLFVEAWTLASNSGEDYFAADVAQMMAVIEPQKVQQEWIMTAIKIAETSPILKTKSWLGGLYSSLGWKLFDLRQFEKSLDVFQNALRHLKAHGTSREAFVAQWSIGKVLRALGRLEEALAIQKTLLAELGIGGARDGRLYEEIAECLQTLQRAPEAQLYFELAYRELSADEWINDNQPLKLKRMKDLGKVKAEQKVPK